MALKLKGSTSGFVGLDAPSVAGNNTLILPENSGSAFQIFANDITAGVTTFTTVTVNRNGDLTVPGTISIGGTLTYEDVTSVDSIGIVTARGLSIFGNTTGLSVTGVGTFAGNVQMTGTNPEFEMNSGGPRFRVPSSNTLSIFTSGGLGATSNERIRITSAGNIGINESSPGHKLVVGGDGYFGFTSPTDAARQIIFNANRGSAGNTLANINWQWNSKNVVQIRGIAGADTSNKDDGHLAFFTSAANSLVERLRIDSSGNVGVNCTSGGGKLAILSNSSTYEGLELQTPSGDSSGEFHIGVHQAGGTAGRNIVFKRGGADGMDTESMRIDSGGRLLIGANSTRDNDVYLQLEGLGYQSSTMQITRNSNNTDGGGIYISKTRGTANGQSTIVQNNDELGYINFRGADGTDTNTNGARIQAFCDGTPGSNDMPGRLVFSTTSDGASSSTARLTIHNNGQTTKPYQYFLLARLSSNITNFDCSSVPGSAIAFNNIIIEQKDSSMSSRFNTSTGLFTAPYTGIYQFVAAAYGADFNTSYSGFTQSWFLVNGARAYSTDWVVPRTAIIQNSQIIKLTAGDTFGFHPHAGGGGDNTSMRINSNNYHTYFKAYFLG